MADVIHPGQVWETAGVALDAGKREDDGVQNWLDCVTVVMECPTS